MKNWAVIVSAVALWSLQSNAGTGIEIFEKAWAPTNLSPQYLDNTITPTFCGYAALRFKGCAAAVDRFLELSDSSSELVMKNGAFDLVPRKAGFRNFKEEQVYRRQKYNEIEAQFSPTALASLMSQYEGLRKRFPNPHPYHIAAAVNEAFGVIYDPHKEILPEFKWNGLNRESLPPTIGVTYVARGERLGIDQVVVNSSAELGGIKPGDIFLKANGKEIRLKPSDDINNTLVFNEGEEVVFTVQRKGRVFEAKLKYSYARRSAVVDRRITVDMNGKRETYLYLYMSEIPDDLGPEAVCRIFKTRILSKANANTDGMVLDLRGNVGGPVDTANCIASLFIGKGRPAVLSEEIETSKIEPEFMPLPKTYFKKLVVLVNATTASAGELLAADLQFYGRALILGDRTFGKSIAQIMLPLPGTKIFLKETTTHIYMPDGVSFQSRGVIPDAFVYRDGLRPSIEEQDTLREEDIALYPLHLKTVKPVAKKAPSPVFPATCVTTDAVTQATEAFSDLDWKKDFQLQYALKTLGCIKAARN